MRERRPYLFSDTVVVSEHALSKEVLSYHLDTLTSRGEETVFEEFAKRLIEKFIAPNIRPQTGPAGGGDGKTDAETYPVREEIAERWFISEPESGSDRWAFAFSAKKDWRAKVRSDVKSIASTERDYAKVYFVSNQYIPSKKSAEIQDAVQKEFCLNLTIIDKTWILDRVFNNSALDIAVEVLGLSGGEGEKSQKPGPRDLERSQELESLEAKISDGKKYEGNRVALAEDCLRAAILSRGLERSREETEGRFLRAIRVSKSHGLPKNELSAKYNYAWTCFFWFDDCIALNSLYDDVEGLAIESDIADELEDISNLYTSLCSGVAYGMLPPAEARLAERRVRLIDALQRVEAEETRPNNSLHARALLLDLQLLEIAKSGDAEALDQLWKQFKEVIERSQGLGTFPFEKIADRLTEVGAYVPESDAFDDLYETLTDCLASRKSEGEAATRNSQRAFQKLSKGLPYEAIRWFGRAVSLLAKDEYQDEFRVALLGSSEAYKGAGLYWAARNYALAAASHEFGVYRRSGSILDVNPAVLTRWFSAELHTGIVPLIISAYELGAVVRNVWSRTDEQREYAEQTQFDQGALLGGLLLKTKEYDLLRLTRLPDGLGRLGLDQARAALLHRMGNEDILRGEGIVPSEVSAEDYSLFFSEWLTSAEDWGIAENPEYLLDDRCSIRSRVLGCEVEIECLTSSYSLSVGAAIIGALESLLATSLNQDFFPKRDRFKIVLSEAGEVGHVPLSEFSYKDGIEVCFVKHGVKLEYSKRAELEGFGEWLQRIVLEIISRIAIPADIEDWGNTVLGEENAFNRSIIFSNVPIMIENIFGNQNFCVEAWIGEGDADYEVRSQGAVTAEAVASSVDSVSDEEPKFGDGDPPAEMLDLERLKHTQIEALSPIDTDQMDKAKWRATFFMQIPHPDGPPPVLGLAFENEEPGKEVFRGLRQRFGAEDIENELRICIVRGVKKSNPFAYAITIGPNVIKIKKSDKKTFVFVSRINVMEPQNSNNLNNFLAEFERHKKFLFVPAYLEGLNVAPKPFMDLGIMKQHLDIREAWQIGENDPDAMALQLDEMPVIPEGVDPDPVVRVWERRRRKRGTK